MLDISCLQVEEATAQYVGPELTTIAALAELPPLPQDSPLDVTLKPEEEEVRPSFALTCQLASTLTGKEQPAGKMLRFSVDKNRIYAIVENHAVADLDVLFHDEMENCASTHAHKVAINGAEAKRKLGTTLKEMQQLSKTLPTKEGAIHMRNAAIHELASHAEEASKKSLASCDVISSAMPSKTSPTSLGTTVLEPGKKEEMSDD